MRITVVGAILIIAGVVVVVLVMRGMAATKGIAAPRRTKTKRTDGNQESLGV